MSDLNFKPTIKNTNHKTPAIRLGGCCRRPSESVYSVPPQPNISHTTIANTIGTTIHKKIFARNLTTKRNGCGWVHIYISSPVTPPSLTGIVSQISSDSAVLIMGGRFFTSPT